MCVHVRIFVYVYVLMHVRLCVNIRLKFSTLSVFTASITEATSGLALTLSVATRISDVNRSMSGSAKQFTDPHTHSDTKADTHTSEHGT